MLKSTSQVPDHRPNWIRCCGRRMSADWDGCVAMAKQIPENPDDEASRREKATLKRLLATPPQPKTKAKAGASQKKRGRPKSESKETKDHI
jgi:hypothetical protein